MKTFLRVLTASVVAMSLSVRALAEERRALLSLPPEDRDLLMTWIQTDCAVDDRELVDRMMLRGAVLEDALLEALELGPIEDTRLEMEAAIPEAYAERQSWMERFGAEAVGIDLQQLVLAESEPEFAAAERNRHDHSWRSAVVAGLGYSCGDRSIDALKGIAENESDPASLTARLALDHCSSF